MTLEVPPMAAQPPRGGVNEPPPVKGDPRYLRPGKRAWLSHGSALKTTVAALPSLALGSSP